MHKFLTTRRKHPLPDLFGKTGVPQMIRMRCLFRTSIVEVFTNRFVLSPVFHLTLSGAVTHSFTFAAQEELAAGRLGCSVVARLTAYGDVNVCHGLNSGVAINRPPKGACKNMLQRKPAEKESINHDAARRYLTNSIFSTSPSSSFANPEN